MRNITFILLLCLCIANAKAQGDLGTFFLRGKVKTLVEKLIVEEEEKVRTYSFDRSGRLVAFDETEASDVRRKIVRKGGRIVKIGELEYGCDLQDLYDYKPTGALKSYTLSSYHILKRETFTEFDERGWPTAAAFDSQLRFMNYQGDGKGRVTYLYSGIDRAGNWTKMVKKGSYTEKGYEILDEQETNETIEIDNVVTRKIVYY